MNEHKDRIIIDHDGRMTLKDQVKNYLLTRIKKDHLKVDEKLPTERELAQLLNVSKRTVENAMRELVRTTGSTRDNHGCGCQPG